MYSTFEGILSCFHFQKSTKLEFLHIVAFALKSYYPKSEKEVNFGFKMYFLKMFWIKIGLTSTINIIVDVSYA